MASIKRWKSESDAERGCSESVGVNLEEEETKRDFLLSLTTVNNNTKRTSIKP